MPPTVVIFARRTEEKSKRPAKGGNAEFATTTQRRWAIIGMSAARAADVRISNKSPRRDTDDAVVSCPLVRKTRQVTTMRVCASEDDPQYEIKSAKTDHIAAHKGHALKKASA